MRTATIDTIENALELLRDRIREHMNEARMAAGDFAIYGKPEDKRRMKSSMIEAGKAIELHDELESQIAGAAANAAAVVLALTAKQSETEKAQA